MRWSQNAGRVTAHKGVKAMLTFAVLLLSSVAFSEPPVAEIRPATADAGLAKSAGAVIPPNPQSIKCRSIQEVGSRIPSRICRTLAEWTRIDEENQTALTDQKRGGGQNPASGTIYN